jgi:hypothetical protein
MGIVRTRRLNIAGQKVFTTNPTLKISGSLFLNNPLTGVLNGDLFPNAGTYDLLTYTGTLSGSAANFIEVIMQNSTLTASAVTHDSANKKFYVVLT